MKLSDKTYDVLKWLALIALPAMITFYGVVGATCHLQYTQEVLTIATAFDTMIGAMLGISTKNYNSESSSKETESVRRQNLKKWMEIARHLLYNRRNVIPVNGLRWGGKASNSYTIPTFFMKIFEKMKGCYFC